jgi:hypothetical protein|tara:strand:+ start:463 stop:669 length:207 start_codon:yes stop_codon:yes gene_type:complete
MLANAEFALYFKMRIYNYMRISNYATKKVEEMRERNDAIATSREEELEELARRLNEQSELDEEALRDD